MERIYVVEACDGSMLLKRAKDPFGNKSLFVSGNVGEEGLVIYVVEVCEDSMVLKCVKDLCC